MPPTLGVRPELVERVELLRDLLHGAVVRLFDAEHALARVVQVRLRLELLQLRHHLLHPRRVNRALLHVGETSELRHRRLQVLRLTPEIVLLRRLVLLELEHELRVLRLDQLCGVLQLPRVELRRREQLPETVVQRSPHRLERVQVRVRLVQHHLLLVARQRDRLRVVANVLDRFRILRRRRQLCVELFIHAANLLAHAHRDVRDELLAPLDQRLVLGDEKLAHVGRVHPERAHDLRRRDGVQNLRQPGFVLGNLPGEQPEPLALLDLIARQQRLDVRVDVQSEHRQVFVVQRVVRVQGIDRVFEGVGDATPRIRHQRLGHLHRRGDRPRGPVQVAHYPRLKRLDPVQRAHAVLEHVQHHGFEPVDGRGELEAGVFRLFGILLDDEVHGEQRTRRALLLGILESNVVRGRHHELRRAPIEHEISKPLHVGLGERTQGVLHAQLRRLDEPLELAVPVRRLIRFLQIEPAFARGFEPDDDRLAHGGDPLIPRDAQVLQRLLLRPLELLQPRGFGEERSKHRVVAKERRVLPRDGHLRGVRLRFRELGGLRERAEGFGKVVRGHVLGGRLARRRAREGSRR